MEIFSYATSAIPTTDALPKAQVDRYYNIPVNVSGLVCIVESLRLVTINSKALLPRLAAPAEAR